MALFTDPDKSQAIAAAPHADETSPARVFPPYEASAITYRHSGGLAARPGKPIRPGQVLTVHCLVLLMTNVLSVAQTEPKGLWNPVPPIAAVPDPVPSASRPEAISQPVSNMGALSASGKLGSDCSANNASDRAGRQWQAEWAVGNKLAAEVERQATFIEDPALKEYVNRLEQAIVRSSELRGCFHVTLLNDVEANAFSLPGGFLYVTSRLILLADSEGQLTAALAHETGHVSARHYARIERERRIWGRLALVGGPAGYLARRFLGSLLTRKLIRNAEFEADRLSLKYQIASRFDPGEFSRLLQSVFQEQGKPPSFGERLVATHPPITTRIKRLDKLTDRLSPATTDYTVDTSDFHQAKKRLALLLKLTNSDASPSEEPD
jgi:Peptidase family M48